MKEQLVKGFMVVLVSVFVCTQPAAAQMLDFSTTPWEVSGQIGASIPSDDDVDTGMFLLGRATYDISPNIAIGATVGWNGYEVDQLGDATSVPLLATVILKMPLEATDNRVVPYLVGGLGVSFWSLDESSLLSNNGISVDNEVAFAGQIGAGVDYYFTDTVAVFGEATYLFTDVDTSVSGPGITGTLEGDADQFFIGAGVKVRL